MRGLHVFFLLLFLASCADRNGVPSGIIKPDSMQVVLRDVIIADQYASQYLLKDSLRRNTKLETLQLFETVFTLHKVTRDEFKRSLDFYESRPDLSKKMFDSLSADANRHRDELFRPKPLPKPIVKDSLK